MQRLTRFFREAGSGPGVVCLHSNASSSSQWRALIETLAPRFHVLAADSYGAGKSPEWPTDRPIWLQDEVALLEPVFARAGDPFLLSHILMAPQSHSSRLYLNLVESVPWPCTSPRCSHCSTPNPLRQMTPRASAVRWPEQLQRLTPPTQQQQPNVSLITGWAVAPGFTRLNRARAQLSHPSITFVGGEGHCSTNPHPLKHSPS
jgi:hypothetical protein